jgi:hypothetical protein
MEKLQQWSLNVLKELVKFKKKIMLITYGNVYKNIDITQNFKKIFIIENIVKIPKNTVFNNIFGDPVFGQIKKIIIKIPNKDNIIINEHRNEDIIIDIKKVPHYKKRKINILAIASRNELYDKMIKVYWIPFISFIEKNYPNVHIYLVFGKDSFIDDLDIIKDNIIVSDSIENYVPGIFFKNIHAFKHLEKDDYDYLIRTNMSSFIMIDRLISYIDTLNRYNIYNGSAHYDVGSKYKYILGWNICMSKDVVSYILNNKDDENGENVIYKVNDDVCFGSILKDKYKTENTHDIMCWDKTHCTDEYIETLLQNNKFGYLFRIKHFHDRNEDIKWLEKLTNIFYT